MRKLLLLAFGLFMFFGVMGLSYAETTTDKLDLGDEFRSWPHTYTATCIIEVRHEGVHEFVPISLYARIDSSSYETEMVTETRVHGRQALFHVRGNENQAASIRMYYQNLDDSWTLWDTSDEEDREHIINSLNFLEGLFIEYCPKIDKEATAFLKRMIDLSRVRE